MTDDFKAAVKEGLSKKPKAIPSRFIYNAEGDRIFQEIMRMPEYYPTRSEYQIFQNQAAKLSQQFSAQGDFQLVELGAGDGAKTKVLIDYLCRNEMPFEYYPVDISGAVLEDLAADLARERPALKVEIMNYEYFTALQQISKLSDKAKVVLFLGGNIGNFTRAEAGNFIKELGKVLNSGDKLLSGIDLKKDPRVIRRAYNDAQGITARFNFNLLKRINEELGGQFDLNLFTHYPSYDPTTGECRSYLVSKIDQQVKIEALNMAVTFERAEAIHTEISRKYHLSEINELAHEGGFTVLKNFSDENQFFVDTLWVKD